MKKFNPSYIGDRPDILNLISSKFKTVLDVGCSNGSLGKSIKEKTGGEVFGIEISKDMACEASNYLDKVYVGDAHKILNEEDFDGKKFKGIIFADLLEHLEDPWAVLTQAVKHLSEDGIIIASIPNIRHISTIINLIFRGYWPYRDRGIHDRTHLRYFTKRNIIELFENSNLKIERINRNYRIFEAPNKINRFAKYLCIPGLRPFFVFQYLISAKHKNNT